MYFSHQCSECIMSKVMHFHSYENLSVFNAFTNNYKKHNIVVFVNPLHNLVLFFFLNNHQVPKDFFIRWLFETQMYFPILIKECYESWLWSQCAHQNLFNIMQLTCYTNKGMTSSWFFMYLCIIYIRDGLSPSQLKPKLSGSLRYKPPG